LIETSDDLLNETAHMLPNNNSDNLYRFINKMAYDKDCRVGYIDVTGNIIVEPKFTYAGRFSEGLAYVSEGEDSGYYYIDSQGNNVFDKYFKNAESFSCGRAVVIDSDDNHIIIDTNGETIADLGNVSASIYADDMLCIKFNSEKYGYADLDGDIVITPTYDFAADFYEGFAAVSFDDQYNLQMINKQGDIVLDSDYTFDVIGYTDRISNGLIRINNDSEQNAGYIDIKGNIVIPFQFKYVSDFSEGLASICSENGLWGFIDQTGKYVIEPKFEWAGDFNEGIAAVYRSNPYWGNVENGVGFIDKEGKLIIDYMYSTFYTAAPMGSLELLNKANGLIDVIWEEEDSFWRGYINDKNEIIFKIKLI
jgi:hypothetical protein